MTDKEDDNDGGCCGCIVAVVTVVLLILCIIFGAKIIKWAWNYELGSYDDSQRHDQTTIIAMVD